MKKMLVICITLSLLLLCACQENQNGGMEQNSDTQTNDLKPNDGTEEEKFTVVITNTCETDIYGLHFEYYLDRIATGGQVISIDPEMSTKIPNNEAVYVAFSKQMFSEDANYSNFGMSMIIILENGEEIMLNDFWEWSAEIGDEYVFTLSGDKETGFELAAENNAEEYKSTDWENLPAEMIPPLQQPVDMLPSNSPEIATL